MNTKKRKEWKTEKENKVTLKIFALRLYLYNTKHVYVYTKRHQTSNRRAAAMTAAAATAVTMKFFSVWLAFYMCPTLLVCKYSASKQFENCDQANRQANGRSTDRLNQTNTERDEHCSWTRAANFWAQYNDHFVHSKHLNIKKEEEEKTLSCKKASWRSSFECFFFSFFLFHFFLCSLLLLLFLYFFPVRLLRFVSFVIVFFVFLFCFTTHIYCVNWINICRVI